MQSTTWTPAVALDLETASSAAFQATIAQFQEWSQARPDEPLGLPTGWHEIPPELSEKLLRRNKRNRRVSLETVKKYARRMQAGQWRKTGQPILITETEEVYDAQHRLWAGYLGSVTFPSYVVADVPEQEDLFAYIDDSKPRNAADSLYTSGSNGLAPMVAAAIKIAFRYEHNALGILKQKPLRSMDNIEVVTYSRQHPGLVTACHDMASNYGRATSVIGNKGVAGFAAWKISENFGPRVLGAFMAPLGSGANLAEGNPILALRNRLMGMQEEQNEDLGAQHRLALLIKAFLMFRSDQTVGKRGLYMRDNERYPRFEDGLTPLAAAAE